MDNGDNWRCQNAERAAEEQRGIIHWLRPDYQTKALASGRSRQNELALPEGATKPGKSKAAKPKAKVPWPKSLAERVRAVENALNALGAPATPPKCGPTDFLRAKPQPTLPKSCKPSVTLGRARRRGKALSR